MNPMLNNLNTITLRAFGGLFCLSFWLSLWFLGLAILLSYILRWLLGDQILPVRLISYLMPWLLILLVPGLIVARLAHKNLLVVILLAPTILICLTYAPLFFSTPNKCIAGLTPLKVMSYNVWRENENMSTVANVIHKESPDILLLQEVKPVRFVKLMGALNHLYSGSELYFDYQHKMLQAVISKYPVIPVDAFPRKALAQKVLLETPNGSITVFNIHPAKRAGWLRRHHQIQSLLIEDITVNDGPLIIGGDFDTTDQTQTYRLVNSYYNNAHWEAGYGFGFTYPAPKSIIKRGFPIPPLVRIDHIFYSHHFIPTSARTLKDSGGSDHLPVVAELITNGTKYLHGS
jgi:vancomycin resistance protein VanJ